MKRKLLVVTAVLILGLLGGAVLAENGVVQASLAAAQAGAVPQAPYPDAPACRSHNPRAYHGLWDATIGCHFDHEHKADPAELDGVFGSQFYEWAGGEISYPWQTTGENRYKHESYAWIVKPNIDPSATQAKDVFVSDLRAQIHAGLHGSGGRVRFHSSYIEMRVCSRSNPSDCGIIRSGGHVDYGELRVDSGWVPLGEQDPVEYEGVEPGSKEERKYDQKLAKRAHSYEKNALTVGWRGRIGQHEYQDESLPLAPVFYRGFDHETQDALSLINPGNPLMPIATVGNNSTHLVRSFVFRAHTEWIKGEDGRMNWSGYTDRFGLRENPACAVPAPNCVPMTIEDVPFWRDNTLFVRFEPTLDEYDVFFEGKSSGWIVGNN